MAFVPVILIIAVLALRGRAPGPRSYVGLAAAGLLLSSWLYFVA